MWPRPTRQDLIEFYGDPDKNRDGQPDIKWEIENLTYIEPPYPMFWSWNGQPVRRIRCHKKCAKSLLRCLEEIKACHTTKFIEEHQLDRCGGGYNFRLMRGGNSLSMHSYGCAIDLAPEINGFGKKWRAKTNMMPVSVVEIFKSHGWKWGGLWGKADAMHFEATQ